MSLDESDEQTVDIREGLDTAVGLLADQLGDRIRVEKEYDETLPPLECVPAKLNQVFLSVLQNSVQGDRRGRLHSNQGRD